LTFRDAQVRLLAYVLDRIHNGELTEREFARMIGISQPHVNSVLKGVRNLSVQISDSILNILNILLLDLVPRPQLACVLKTLVSQRVRPLHILTVQLVFGPLPAETLS
jgi:transcriptional regulator with XRE-family HTH domain